MVYIWESYNQHKLLLWELYGATPHYFKHTSCEISELKIVTSAKKLKLFCAWHSRASVSCKTVPYAVETYQHILNVCLINIQTDHGFLYQYKSMKYFELQYKHFKKQHIFICCIYFKQRE